MKTIEGEVFESSKSESEIKRLIYEKVRKRMAELVVQSREPRSLCPELNPDVIVISDDQSLLFEPQNQRALELLTMKCGLTVNHFKLPERIRVHPCKSAKIIADLTIAGLKVAG